MQSYQKKPEVFFDVTNEEHRLAAQYFVKNNAWGYPWIFVLEKGYRDITVMVKEKMLNYYIDKDKIHVG